MKSILGKTHPDPFAAVFKTSYFRFCSPIGIDGLCKLSDGRLELLAVIANRPGKGHFRKFIRQAKLEYSTICVWEIWNPFLDDVLSRYGFFACEEYKNGETVTGWRWDRGGTISSPDLTPETRGA